jgi:hypothetical protein
MTDNEVIAKELKSAFMEGASLTLYQGYNTMEDAWNASSTKHFHDSLTQEDE